MSVGKTPVILHLDLEVRVAAAAGALYESADRSESAANGLRGIIAIASGIKTPFLDQADVLVAGQATIKLSEVQLNVPIDAAKFAKPAPPVERKP